MSTLTNHYNVAVQSRFYAFLQEDCESEEPQDLIAIAKKKREILKQNKSEAKKDKRAKQIAELKKEINIEDNKQINDIGNDAVNVDVESVVDALPNVTEEISLEQRGETRSGRGQRGHGMYKRGHREGSFKNDEKSQNDDIIPRSQNENFQRSYGNSRGRPYRREKTDDREDSFNKVGYFEESSKSGYREETDRRRPYSRGGRSSRGNDRIFSDDYSSRIEKPDGFEILEEGHGSAYPRNNRGRYPRSNRGSFNRFTRPVDGEGVECDQNKIGYFDENVDNFESRGSGHPRGGRGVRRGGRGDFHRPRPQESNHTSAEANETKAVEQSEEPIDSWDAVKDEVNLDKLTHEDSIVMDRSEDKKKADWGEIEDDHGEAKVDQKVTMTLDEWKALKEQTLRVTMDNREDLRKANDGRDVFSGMSQYRKGKGVGGGEEQIEEMSHEAHAQETGHSKVKQAIPVSVRFSRSMDSGANVGPGQVYDQGGGRGRGRGRIGGEHRGGRDYGRGRGRGSRGGTYDQEGGRRPRRSQGEPEEGPADVSINLGNEDEFPHLS